MLAVVLDPGVVHVLVVKDLQAVVLPGPQVHGGRGLRRIGVERFVRAQQSGGRHEKVGPEVDSRPVRGAQIQTRRIVGLEREQVVARSGYRQPGAVPRRVGVADVTAGRRGVQHRHESAAHGGAATLVDRDGGIVDGRCGAAADRRGCAGQGSGEQAVQRGEAAACPGEAAVELVELARVARPQLQEVDRLRRGADVSPCGHRGGNRQRIGQHRRGRLLHLPLLVGDPGHGQQLQVVAAVVDVRAPARCQAGGDAAAARGVTDLEEAVAGGRPTGGWRVPTVIAGLRMDDVEVVRLARHQVLRDGPVVLLLVPCVRVVPIKTAISSGDVYRAQRHAGTLGCLDREAHDVVRVREESVPTGGGHGHPTRHTCRVVGAEILQVLQVTRSRSQLAARQIGIQRRLGPDLGITRKRGHCWGSQIAIGRYGSVRKAIPVLADLSRIELLLHRLDKPHAPRPSQIGTEIGRRAREAQDPGRGVVARRDGSRAEGLQVRRDGARPAQGERHGQDLAAVGRGHHATAELQRPVRRRREQRGRQREAGRRSLPRSRAGRRRDGGQARHRRHRGTHHAGLHALHGGGQAVSRGRSRAVEQHALRRVQEVAQRRGRAAQRQARAATAADGDGGVAAIDRERRVAAGRAGGDRQDHAEQLGAAAHRVGELDIAVDRAHREAGGQSQAGQHARGCRAVRGDDGDRPRSRAADHDAAAAADL